MCVCVCVCIYNCIKLENKLGSHQILKYSKIETKGFLSNKIEGKGHFNIKKWK